MLPTRPRLALAAAQQPHTSPQGFSAAYRRWHKNWFAVEALPIVIIVGSALSAGTWLLYRATKRPDVVWTNSNPEPWRAIAPDETVKLWHGHKTFEKRWKRPDW